MRYLVFGDVHGNLQALETVLSLARGLGVEGYLCVGDVIGYGPEPVECLRRLHALASRGCLGWVAGNHELVVRNEIPLEDCNSEAQCTLVWTRQMLESEPWALEFVASAHRVVEVEKGIWLTHDSLTQPSSGHYHRWPQDAKTELDVLTRLNGRVAFYGHTHTIRAELLRGNGDISLAPMEPETNNERDAHPLRVSRGQHAWIGTGSVGFPRTPQRHAECLVLDDADWSVEKYAVPYPREQARERVHEVLGPACGQDLANRIARWL